MAWFWCFVDPPEMGDKTLETFVAEREHREYIIAIVRSFFNHFEDHFADQGRAEEQDG
jgi:hypothetical protein